MTQNVHDGLPLLLCVALFHCRVSVLTPTLCWHHCCKTIKGKTLAVTVKNPEIYFNKLQDEDKTVKRLLANTLCMPSSMNTHNEDIWLCTISWVSICQNAAAFSGGVLLILLLQRSGLHAESGIMWRRWGVEGVAVFPPDAHWLFLVIALLVTVTLSALRRWSCQLHYWYEMIKPAVAEATTDNLCLVR